MFLIFEQILEENVGYEIVVKPTVTDSCMYIRGDSYVQIRGSTSCNIVTNQ